MKHRRKEEEVLTTDEDDFDVRVPSEGLFQTQRCIDAGKATTQDDDPLWPVRGAFRAVPEEKHGNLLAAIMNRSWRASASCGRPALPRESVRKRCLELYN